MDDIKPAIQGQKASIMGHAADVASDVPTDFVTLLAKTNMNLHAPNKLVFFPRMNILADKTSQANVVYCQRYKPHPVGDFVTVCSLVWLDD